MDYEWLRFCMDGEGGAAVKPARSLPAYFSTCDRKETTPELSGLRSVPFARMEQAH